MHLTRSWLTLLLLLPGLLYAASSESNEAQPEAEASEAAAPRLDPGTLAERALEIEAREAALRELEAEVRAQIEELERLQRTALEVLEPERQQRAEDLEKLVKFYQSMKPRSAAELLEKLPLELATSVLSRMKQREAGKILNVMSPARAVQISKRMAAEPEP